MTDRTPSRAARPLAIVATTPDDSHGWNLTDLALQLDARGFVVENLGPCTPDDLLAETIRDRRPALVALSSLNGHGALSIPRLLATLERYQVKRLAPIVAGGLLTTDPAAAAGAAEALREAGLAAVFSGPAAWAAFDRFLARRRLGRPASTRPEGPSSNESPPAAATCEGCPNADTCARRKDPPSRQRDRPLDEIPDWVNGGG